MKLKPCPFCGNTVEIEKTNGYYCVYCSGCYVRSADYCIEKEAIISWNLRIVELNLKK